VRAVVALCLALAAGLPAAPARAEAQKAAPAKKTALPPYRLVRVLPETHQALLLDKTKGKHVLVDAGESVGDYEVTEIDVDHVVLSRRGDTREFVLVAGEATPTTRLADPYAMPDPPAPATTSPAGPSRAAPSLIARLLDPYGPDFPDPYGTNGVPEVQAPPGQRASEEPAPPPPPPKPAKIEAPVVVVEPLRTSFTVSRKELDTALGDFAKLGKQVDMKIVAGGVALQRVAPDSFFHAMGLRDGDLVKKVDGKPIRSLDDAARIYARLGKAKQFEVAIDRAGDPLTLKYQITK